MASRFVFSRDGPKSEQESSRYVKVGADAASSSSGLSIAGVQITTSLVGRAAVCCCFWAVPEQA